MLIKFHETKGRFFYKSKEEFEEFATEKEKFRDATEREIVQYIKDAKAASQPKEFPKMRLRQAKAKAIRMSQHCEMMGETDLAQQWRKYYQAIHQLSTQETIPAPDTWPKRPKEI